MKLKKGQTVYRGKEQYRGVIPDKLARELGLIDDPPPKGKKEKEPKAGQPWE